MNGNKKSQNWGNSNPNNELNLNELKQFVKKRNEPNQSVKKTNESNQSVKKTNELKQSVKKKGGKKKVWRTILSTSRKIKKGTMKSFTIDNYKDLKTKIEMMIAKIYKICKGSKINFDRMKKTTIDSYIKNLRSNNSNDWDKIIKQSETYHKSLLTNQNAIQNIKKTCNGYEGYVYYKNMLRHLHKMKPIEFKKMYTTEKMLDEYNKNKKKGMEQLKDHKKYVEDNKREAEQNIKDYLSQLHEKIKNLRKIYKILYNNKNNKITNINNFNINNKITNINQLNLLINSTKKYIPNNKISFFNTSNLSDEIDTIYNKIMFMHVRKLIYENELEAIKRYEEYEKKSSNESTMIKHVRELAESIKNAELNDF